MKFEKAMPLPCPTLAPADASETSRKGHGKVIDRSLTVPPFQGQGKGNDPHHAGRPDSMPPDTMTGRYAEHLKACDRLANGGMIKQDPKCWRWRWLGFKDYVGAVFYYHVFGKSDQNNGEPLK